MADAVVTWRLTPAEARIIRESLIELASNCQGEAREIRGGDPKRARDLDNAVKELNKIIERI